MYLCCVLVHLVFNFRALAQTYRVAQKGMVEWQNAMLSKTAIWSNHYKPYQTSYKHGGCHRSVRAYQIGVLKSHSSVRGGCVINLCLQEVCQSWNGRSFFSVGIISSCLNHVWANFPSLLIQLIYLQPL